MPDVAQLVVKISGDNTDATKKMSDTDTLMGRVKAGFEHGIGAALAWKAVDAVFAGVKDSISLVVGNLQDIIAKGIEANQVDAQLAAGLKSTHDASGMTAQSLDDLAAKMSSQTGITDDAVKASESMLLTFTNIGKNVFPQATQAVADLATKMSNGAVPSAQQMEQASIQLGKALGDPTKGYAQLQRVGVTFNAQQIEQIKTMQKSGDIAGAQAIILGEMNKEFGGSADAAGQANGGMAIFSATLDNLKATVGQAIIPVLTQLLTAVMPLVQGFGQALPGALSTVQGLFSQLQPIVSAIGQAVQFLANVAISAFKPAFEEIGQALSKVQGPGLSVKGVVAGINNVVQQATPFIQQVAKAFGQLGVWFVTQGLPAIKSFATWIQVNVLPVLKQLGTFIVTTVVPAVEQFATFITTTVIPAIGQLWTWFSVHVLPILEQVVTIVVTDVLPALENIANTVMKNLVPALENLWNKISPILIPALQFVGAILKNVVGPAISFVIGVVSTFINIIAGLIGKIGDVMGVLGNLKDLLWGAISGAWTHLGDVVSGIWSGIQGAIKDGINVVIDIIDNMISKINGISIDIPKVGPVGGGHIGFNIPLIPHLATGGDVSGLFVGAENGMELLVKPGLYSAPAGSHVYSASQTAALLGAGTSAPLGASGTASGSIVIQPGTSLTIPLHVNGRTFATAILPDLVTAIRTGTGIRHVTA